MSEVYEASDDTFLLWDATKEYLETLEVSSSCRVLDMGAGSGYLGFEALKMGCQVTFADINPQSTAFIQSVVESEDLPCKVLTSDLFENITGEFDVIVFNTPYLPDETGEEVHDIALHGGKEGITVAKNFLKHAKNFLAKGAKIFLLASSLGNQEQLQLYAQSLGYQWRIVKKESLFFEELLVYEFVRNDTAFDMQDQKQIEELKTLIPSSFIDAHLLHRGKRGVVFKGVYAAQPAVIKLLRPGVDARNTIHLEANYLRKANEQGIGPKLFEATDDFVIMQYIPGTPIGEFLQSCTDSAILRKLLTDIFSQLRTLDSVQLNKFELTNPYKHIIVTTIHEPIMIDFERMRFAARPKNVTQFAQYITSKAVLPHLQACGVLVHADLFSEEIKKYASGEEVVFEQHF